MAETAPPTPQGPTTNIRSDELLAILNEEEEVLPNIAPHDDMQPTLLNRLFHGFINLRIKRLTKVNPKKLRRIKNRIKGEELTAAIRSYIEDSGEMFSLSQLISVLNMYQTRSDEKEAAFEKGATLISGTLSTMVGCITGALTTMALSGGQAAPVVGNIFQNAAVQGITWIGLTTTLALVLGVAAKTIAHQITPFSVRYLNEKEKKFFEKAQEKATELGYVLVKNKSNKFVPRRALSARISAKLALLGEAGILVLGPEVKNELEALKLETTRQIAAGEKPTPANMPEPEYIRKQCLLHIERRALAVLVDVQAKTNG